MKNIDFRIRRLFDNVLHILKLPLSAKANAEGTYIACPRCDWRPDISDVWDCPNCRGIWNVFTTHAVCPRCGTVSQTTHCLKCDQWSDHQDWYHFDDDLTVEELIAHPERLAQPTRALDHHTEI